MDEDFTLTWKERREKEYIICVIDNQDVLCRRCAEKRHGKNWYISELISRMCNYQDLENMIDESKSEDIKDIGCCNCKNPVIDIYWEEQEKLPKRIIRFKKKGGKAQ